MSNADKVEKTKASYSFCSEEKGASGTIVNIHATITRCGLRVHSANPSNMNKMETTRPIYNFNNEERISSGAVINIQATTPGRLTRAALEELVELLRDRESRILELERRLHDIGSRNPFLRS